MFTRQLWNMLVLARVITVGALMRDESRGSHYKPEFPERDDEKFMKTTIAQLRRRRPTTGPKITYEDDRHLAGQAGASATTPASGAQAAAPRGARRPTCSSQMAGKTVAAQDQAAGRAGRAAALGRVRGAVGGAPQRARGADGDSAQARRRATGKKTTPVVWDANCLEEVCGSCTMIINGRVRRPARRWSTSWSSRSSCGR